MPANPTHALSTQMIGRRQFLGAGMGVGAALLLAACGRASDTDSAQGTTAAGAEETGGATPVTLTEVGFDYPFTFLPVYAGVTRFAQERADAEDVELSLTNDDAKLEKQVANLTTWINQPIGSIVSFPMEPTAIEPLAEQARAAGVIWVSYGGTMQNQDASITFSFEQGGRLLGEAAAAWANETLGGTGKVAFLVDEVIELGRLRTKGMVEGFTENAPNVQVVAQQQAIAPDQALTATSAILAANPDVNIILCVTDDGGTGAYQALTQAGRAPDDATTFVGGQDGGKAALELIKQGTFYRASAALQLRDIGNAVIDVPLAVAAGDPDASEDVPITLVVNGDALIDDLIAQYE